MILIGITSAGPNRDDYSATTVIRSSDFEKVSLVKIRQYEAESRVISPSTVFVYKESRPVETVIRRRVVYSYSGHPAVVCAPPVVVHHRKIYTTTSQIHTHRETTSFGFWFSK
jgi:hypothetical protein